MVNNDSKIVLRKQVDDLQDEKRSLIKDIDALQSRLQPLLDRKQEVLRQIQALKDDIGA